MALKHIVLDKYRNKSRLNRTTILGSTTRNAGRAAVAVKASELFNATGIEEKVSTFGFSSSTIGSFAGASRVEAVVAPGSPPYVATPLLPDPVDSNVAVASSGLYAYFTNSAVTRDFLVFITYRAFTPSTYDISGMLTSGVAPAFSLYVSEYGAYHNTVYQEIASSYSLGDGGSQYKTSVIRVYDLDGVDICSSTPGTLVQVTVTQNNTVNASDMVGVHIVGISNSYIGCDVVKARNALVTNGLNQPIMSPNTQALDYVIGTMAWSSDSAVTTDNAVSTIDAATLGSSLYVKVASSDWGTYDSSSTTDAYGALALGYEGPSPDPLFNIDSSSILSFVGSYSEGSVDYPLVIAQGTLALVGADTVITREAYLAAITSNLSIAYISSPLVAARRILVVSHAVAIFPEVIELFAARVLAVSSIAFIAEPNSSNLIVQRSLVVAVTAYSEVGNIANLLVTYIRKHEEASYNLALLEAEISAGKTYKHDEGSFAVVGESIGLEASRSITSATAIYEEVVEDVGLVRGYSSVLSSVALALQGNNLPLALSRNIVAESGAYVVEMLPSPANLDKILRTEGLALVVIGELSEVLARRYMQPEEASYSIGTDPVELEVTRARSISTEPGDFTIVGQSISIVSPKFLTAESANYYASMLPVTWRPPIRIVVPGIVAYELDSAVVGLTYSNAFHPVMTSDTASYILDVPEALLSKGLQMRTAFGEFYLNQQNYTLSTFPGDTIPHDYVVAIGRRGNTISGGIHNG